MTVGTDVARAAVLITATALAEALRAAAPPAVLDVRWALGDPHGYDDYLAARIPGARFVDLEGELSAPPAPHLGRHPLPAIDELQRAARGWGLNQGQPVVVYDATGAQAAARAWWVLRWAGVADVRILDGGLPAWVRAGFAVESGALASEADGGGAGLAGGDVVLTGGQLPVVDADAAALLARSGVLLDARAAARYRGEVEPIDPRSGHIPGAVSAPTAQNLNEDATFRSNAELRQRFDDLAATGATGATGDVGVYCGSGVTAAHEIAALAAIGVPAVLYAGSWSQWSADPGRPAASGAEPG